MLRAPLATGLLFAALIALDAQARPSAGSIVVNRDGAIGPGRTSTLTAFCPRGYVAFTWGFRTLATNARSQSSPILVGAEPVLRATGGVSGYVARFTNPHQTTKPVRLSVTCVRPIDMDIRLKLGTRPARATEGASAAARPPTLALAVKERKERVAPSGFVRVRQFCSGDATPRRVPVSSSFTLGGARLAGNYPIQKGGRYGWIAEFANPTDRAQSVESRVVCAEGRRMAVSFAGAGRAQAAVRARTLHVDARKVFEEKVTETPLLFSGTCQKGMFSQYAHRALNRGEPRHVPILSDWAHFPSPSFHESMSRLVGFDYEEVAPNLDLILQPLCIKAKSLRTQGSELILEFAS
ncbi:MAG: hypothetical protein ACRDJY_05760 [Thermoleophilaceae bacterium]